MSNNGMTGEAKISVTNVSHDYPDPDSGGRKQVLSKVSFDVSEGEVMSIIGPSGCGKSTLMSIIAGLVMPSGGEVKVNGQIVDGPSPTRILLFQELFLFEWMTTLGNVEFALEARRVSKPDRRQKAIEILNLVGLAGFENYYPNKISGGMKQKLALARALAAEPQVLLLDEPFGALDLQTRNELEFELLNLLKFGNQTVIIVTHDIRQAIFLGDRILVMSPRPATIKKSFVVPFPHRRQEGIRLTREFNDLETLVSASIHSER